MLPLTFPSFSDAEIENLKHCLNSKWVTQGPFVDQFEKMFAERHKVAYAFACTSCTTALHMAAWALDIKQGDEVLVPAFTWITSANCVEFLGARAVFVDVEASTFNVDPMKIEAAITPNTRAIVVVHLFGLTAKMDEISTIAKKYNLAIIEDAACATGSTYNDLPIGNNGNMACFSFHPRKVVTTGEGGMITTADPEIAKRLRAIRSHGGSPATFSAPYAMGAFDSLGTNYRLSDIQAAVGVAQMTKLDSLLAERLMRANRYYEMLADVSDDLGLPCIPEKCGHTYQSYVIRVLEGGEKRRNKIMDYLFEQGIQTRPGTHAVHRLGYYANKYNIAPTEFPIASLCEDTTITVPIFPGMTDQDQETVATCLKTALGKQG